MPDELPIVLVVDDDKEIREFVVGAVNRFGYPAIARKDVDGAVEAVETTPSLQVLLCDICLEASTGPDLVRRALTNRPELKVVFMSGGFDNVFFRRTDPLLGKPFTLEQLRQAINGALSQGPIPWEQRPRDLERRRLGLLPDGLKTCNQN